MANRDVDLQDYRIFYESNIGLRKKTNRVAFVIAFVASIVGLTILNPLVEHAGIHRGSGLSFFISIIIATAIIATVRYLIMVKWELLFPKQWELYMNQLETFKPAFTQKLKDGGYDEGIVEFLNPRSSNSVYLYPKIQIVKENKIYVVSSNPGEIYF